MSNKSMSNGKGSGPVGRAVEDLNLSERWEYANRWVAFKIYTPPEKIVRDGMEYVDVRHRKIEAIGTSIDECLSQLRSRNLDPSEFEFIVLKPPY
jgi:hypothetical protein